VRSVRAVFFMGDMRGVYERPCWVCGYEGSKLGVDNECVGSFVDGCVDPGDSLGCVGVSLMLFS
jgi:hypothetical protein